MADYTPIDAEPQPPAQALPTAPRPLSELIALAGNQAPECISGFVDRTTVICCLAEILLDAHAAGRIHGDLRPDNVLVSTHGAVTVIGWGGTDPDRMRAAPYRAPEAIAGASSSVASDIYAVGTILWELLTLRPALVVEENLTRFHRRKRAGEVDPLPGKVKNSVPGELLDLARKAMSPDPALRWQSMEELLTALHGWLRRLESVAITLQAEGELSGAAEGKGEGDHAASAFRSALALWPGNPAAQDGLSAAEGLQTITAIGAGDEQAAVGHLGQSSGAVHAAVTVELRRMQARNRRRRWGRAVLLGLLVLVAGAGAWLWQRPSSHSGTWKVDAEWVLGRGARTSGLETSWRSIGEVEPLNTPIEDGLLPVKGHIIWLKDIDGRGDVRLGVELEWGKQIDGFELMIAAPRVQPPSWYMTQPGYSCQFGGFRGTQTFLSSSPEAGWPQRPAPIAHAFVPGRRYRLEMERQDEHLRLRIDGAVVWDQREVVPVGDSRFRWLALRTWTQVKIHRIYVEKPQEQPPLTPLSTADALASAGHHADALAAYEAALRTELPLNLRSQAIAKAHLVASRLPDSDDKRLKLLRLAEHDIPADSPYQLDVLQAEALSLWRAREWTPALRLAERIQSRYPETRCALAMLGRRIEDIPETALAALLRLVCSGPPVSHLSLAGLGLTDLSPLHGMRLESLDISGNRIVELAALAGMPLRRLVCADNLIADLAPLKGMPLILLDAGGNRIVDLGPLAGAPIERLILDRNQIVDLGPLARMPLTRLTLLGDPIASLAPLAGCTELDTLLLSDAPVSDLAPLPFHSLTTLSMLRCPVSDVRPLAASHIVDLTLSGTRVSDVGALPRATIGQLRLADTPIASLASLAGLNLTVLDLSGTPLAQLNGIADIGMGEHTWLLLDRTPLTSLALLDKPQLDTLSIRNTRIRDLAPLAGRSILRLYADGVPAEDLQPVFEVQNLQRLSLWNTGSTGVALDAIADRMERDRRLPAIADVLRIHAAAKDKDWRRLRAMARRIGAYDRLPLGVELTYPEAAAFAAAAGARLPCPLGNADLLSVANQPTVTSWFWVGLQPRTNQSIIPRWENGRTDPHLALMILPQPDLYQGAAWTCPISPTEALLHPIDAKALPFTRNAVVLEW